MPYITRELSQELKQSASEYPIVTLLGPRQSGKTTLAKKFFADKKYVSLENLQEREFALQDPKGFLKTYASGAIIDEVQRVPEILSYLQTEVDENPSPGRFILTGSNQFLLQEKITQSLAGRVSLLRLLPFSLAELKSFHQDSDLILEQLMFNGGYPRLYAEKLRPKIWLDNYIETYVDKDVRLIKNIENLSQFQLFLKMCAARVGQLLNLASLGNDCGISQNTVKSWLSVLESSFIVKLIYPHHENFNKRLVKSPKIYFYDTGLLCRLLSLNDSSELEGHALRGSIFENFVLTELMKQLYNRADRRSVFFWRDKNGHEIDFLMEGNPTTLIEAKSGRTVNTDYFKNLNYLLALSGKDFASYLVYAGEEEQKRAKFNVVSWKQLMTLKF